MNKEDLRNRVWTETPLAQYAMMNGAMKAGDFKKTAHFRTCFERNCFTCANYVFTHIRVSGTDETTREVPVCRWNPFNTRTQFVVKGRNVCDYWRLRLND